MFVKLGYRKNDLHPEYLQGELVRYIRYCNHDRTKMNWSSLNPVQYRAQAEYP